MSTRKLFTGAMLAVLFLLWLTPSSAVIAADEDSSGSAVQEAEKLFNNMVKAFDPHPFQVLYLHQFQDLQQFRLARALSYPLPHWPKWRP